MTSSATTPEKRAVTIVCAFKAGGDFEPRHVQWLAKQVPNLVCITSAKINGVKTIEPSHDWPGWWVKMNAFSPELFAGDMLLMDLDTVVLKMPELPIETTVLTDFTKPDIIGSGFMYVTAEDRARVWEAFVANPDAHMRACTHWPKLGDQGFLIDYLASAKRWGENIRSYKVHCQKSLPSGTEVVCFHGKPRPWNAVASWIPQLAFGDFRDLILKHKGKRFLVLGGGPTLKEDFDKITADVVISVNAHGAELGKVDYVLAMDENNSKTRGKMGEFIRSKTDAPIISPHGYCDIRLAEWPQQPRFVLSGLVAIWAAYLMGAKVVYLAGFDSYGNNPGYMHEAEKIARDVRCEVRVVDGPLLSVWKKFDSKERFTNYAPHAAIEGWQKKDGQTTIRVRKPCIVNGQQAKIGEVATVYRNQVWPLLKHRMIEEI